jgi:adenine-specific DNA-methyltransferase
MHKKNNGSYYTPELLADFIMAHVSPHFEASEKLSILEPSAGDGSFIRSFNKAKFPSSIKHYSFQAVEKIKPELEKAIKQANTNRKKDVRFSFVKNDFLKFQASVNRKFSFIAGNPPYIKKSLLNKTQIELCQQIHTTAGLSEASIKNIWPYFLIRCCQLLDENGVLAFVLPAELLQINFSVELRQFLINNFERTEIFTFEDLLFECKGQDTVLLIAYKRHPSPGQYYAHINNLNQLSSNNFQLKENNALKITSTKWTHHLLSADDLTFIHKIGTNLNTIDHYCESKPGIVTAGNKFFIVNEETEKLFNLTDFVKPIIQKGFFVNGSVVFDEKEYSQLVREGKPTKVLCISDRQATKLPVSVQKYLEIGAQDKLSTGYKCSKRKNWFVIPNIAEVPDGYPKLLKNDADVLVTDTAYKIEMRKNYNISNLIYSFYNSLSLAFTELGGRYYGGGVLELTPSEFEAILLPYAEISERKFNNYVKVFENKKNITDVLNLSDFEILNTSLGLNAEEIKRIQSIYQKLISKRFREKAE